MYLVKKRKVNLLINVRLKKEKRKRIEKPPYYVKIDAIFFDRCIIFH